MQTDVRTKLVLCHGPRVRGRRGVRKPAHPARGATRGPLEGPEPQRGGGGADCSPGCRRSSGPPTRAPPLAGVGDSQGR